VLPRILRQLEAVALFEKAPDLFAADVLDRLIFSGDHWRRARAISPFRVSGFSSERAVTWTRRQKKIADVFLSAGFFGILEVGRVAPVGADRGLRSFCGAAPDVFLSGIPPVIMNR
jgi:hypothetical protein